MQYWIRTKEKKPNLMHVRYSRIINLGQKLSCVLVRGSRVVPDKPSEIWHPKPMRIWQGIKMIWIRFLICPCLPFGREPELSQSSGNLFPYAVSHPPTDIVSCPRCIRCWCPSEEHVGHRSVGYPVTHRMNIRPIGHCLVKWLLQV
jgi:hypothetical protein